MIEMLVDRLRWPAAMVRERTASQLGLLIVEDYPGVREALLDWTKSQDLESLAAMGFLPFLYAAARSSDIVPDSVELEAVCRARSILSEMYLFHLDQSHQIRIGVGRHSGTPPGNWEIPISSSERQILNVESICRSRLEMCEPLYATTLIRQFEYEMHSLRCLYGGSARRSIWAQGSREKGFHPGWHSFSHEICLSAYLRTLAWAASNEMLPNDKILYEAASVSPIDLALWNVQPGAKPEWWPNVRIQSDSSRMESETSRLIRFVENVAADWGAGSQVLLAAGGSLSETTLRRHNLEIRSFLQSAQGPTRPTSQDLFSHLKSVKAFVFRDDSPLSFSGQIKVDTGPQRLRDWHTVPCAGMSHVDMGNIWQAWRGIRGVHCPSHLLAKDDLYAVCREDSIDFQGSEGLIARWTDWSEGVSALFVNGPLPANGWMLTAPQEVVTAIKEATGMQLAWVWEMTSHFRSSTFEEFKELRMYGESGTSLVIRP